MAHIRKIYEDDAQTTQIFPQTHERAVVDNNGTTLETKLGLKQDIITAVVSPTVTENGGSPGASVSFEEGQLSFAFQNLRGEQGVKGDTTILGNEDEYTLYNVEGSNTDGAMTQIAVTDAIHKIKDTPLFSKSFSVSASTQSRFPISPALEVGKTYVVRISSQTAGNADLTANLYPNYNTNDNTCVRIGQLISGETYVILLYTPQEETNYQYLGFWSTSAMNITISFSLKDATIKSIYNYRYRNIFTNGQAISWTSGNVRVDHVIESYANRYYIIKRPSDITHFVITKGESTYTLLVEVPVDSTHWYSLGIVSGTVELNVSAFDKVMLLLYDKPSASDAQDVPITVIGKYTVSDFVPINNIVHGLGQSEEKIMSQKAVTDIFDAAGIEYSTNLFTNGNSIQWETGNIDPNTFRFTTYANKYFVIDKPSNIDEIVVEKGESQYGLVVYGSTDGETWTTFGNFSGTSSRINVESYNYLCVLLWDMPSLQDARSVDITMTGYANAVKDDEKRYTNPIIREDNPDPTVWYGEDGYYYLYATGYIDTKTLYRSANLVDWEDTEESPLTQSAKDALQEAFGSYNLFWAPCVKKMGNGKWNMYLTKPYGGVAILTSDYPTFGYEFVRFTTATFSDYIDPDIVVDLDNTVWMFAGSNAKMFRRQMTSDGLNFAESSEWVHVAGRPGSESGNTARVKTFEGEYLYRRKGYWYLFCSSGQYENSTYAVRVVRSQTLTGTFVDKSGNAATDGYAEYVIQSSGALYGPGHNGQIFVDKENKTWMLYHSHWTGFSSSSKRGVCIDEIKWDEDGWPYVEEGKPSLSNIAPKM